MHIKGILVLAAALTAGVSSAGTLRILPLGDSITYGQGWDPHGGYRAVLREKLVAAGYDVDYVGSETRNPGTLKESGDVEHEGHPGWRVDQIAKMLPIWSGSFDAPHAILLMIGTNNCNGNHDAVMAQMRALLDEIALIHPSAVTVVATLPPFLNGRSVGGNNVWVEDQNKLIRAEVAQRAAKGGKVRLADVYPAVSPTEGMNDDRHPNKTGYIAMAQVWFDALKAAFPNPAAIPADVAATAVHAKLDGESGNVTVWFSRPIDAVSAKVANFACKTVKWASAAVADDARSVTLTPARPLKPGVAHAISVKGVKSGRTSVVPRTFTLAFYPRGARNYVPEAARYRKVYGYDIPSAGGALNKNGVKYALDDHEKVGKFTRVAYYVELVDATGALKYLWVSMDAFTDDASKIAVPTKQSGAFFQQYVANMRVYSNVPTVDPGEKARGNIEFWPFAYYPSRQKGLHVEGASDKAYDVDDSCNMSGGFACMQIHDTDALKPLFCYNNWGDNAGGTCDLGLGPNPSGNPDWTQSGGGNSWPGGRKLEVYVMEGASRPASGSGVPSTSRVKAK